MWYTAQSGIWQPVWLEWMPAAHVASLRLVADLEAEELRVEAVVAGSAALTVTLLDADGAPAASDSATPADGIVSLALPVPSPHPWSPEDPYLYQVRIAYGTDEIGSYCAFRTVCVALDAQGTPRFTLNGKPYFLRGLLDQGYWPESLLTPPSDEAMAFDIRTAKELGFNCLRKHIKVEPERWYYLCDRLGMLVLQDMPSGGSEQDTRVTRDIPTLFRGSWHRRRDTRPGDFSSLASACPRYQAEWIVTCEETVTRLAAHPCIAAWVLFNEGWGQFRAEANAARVRERDATRPILACSGWYDEGAGDFVGIHNYFRKMHRFGDPYARHGRPARAELLSEFGGLGWHVEGHSCLDTEYGYASFDSVDAWRAGLRDLLAQVDELEAEGLSGFVYTQLTDVEEETNGLLTYDRRVNKLRD